MRTVSYRAPRLVPRVAEPAALGGLALLAGMLGWIVVRFDGFGPNLTSSILFTAGGFACLAVIAAGPVPCLAAIGVVTAGGLSPHIGSFGGVDVTAADIFYCGLVGWSLVEVVRRSGDHFSDPPRRIEFGQGAAIIFLAYAGLTLWKVASEPTAFSDSLISWLRLVQTASLAWLAASFIRTGRDLKLLVAAVTVGGIVAIVVAGFGGGAVLTHRYQGTLTPDELGLVSGLVLVIGAFGAVTPAARYRILLAVAGIIGLFLAKSVASFVATGFVVAVGAALIGGPSLRATQRATRVVLVIALAGVLVFAVVRFLRPSETPGSTQFQNSSAYQRIIVGAAGLQIFERNPVFGVGWRGSNSPKVIGEPSISEELRKQFPDANPIFYPDVNPKSVHNTYIQILADLGIVGFGLLLTMIAVVGARVRGLLRRLGPGHALWPQVWVMTLGVVLVLVWLNDNPLYGGQPETVIPALFLGGLAAVNRIAPSADTARTSRGR